MTEKTTTTTRKIAGHPVLLVRRSDGIQRHEWLGEDAAYGVAYKSKWSPRVTATRPGRETKVFGTFEYGGTEQAFTAARLWLVGGAA